MPQPRRKERDATPDNSAIQNGIRANPLVPWLVLLASLVLTWQAWHTAKRETDKELREYFDFRVREAVLLTEQRMLTQEQALRGMQGLFKAAGNVSRGGFHDYIDSLHLQENYPGIHGMGFTLFIPPEQKDRHVAAVRQEGFPEYALRPDGRRDVYTSIVYIEPFRESNLRAFGYDMYSEPVRRAAMERARDTGQASLSGKVTLVQENGDNAQAGFLLYLPVYRNGQPHHTLAERRANLIGWVYSPFRMNDLAQGMYGERAADLDIEIYDGTAVSAAALMYDSYSGDNQAEPLQTVRHLVIAGHSWTLLIRSMPGLASRIDMSRPASVATSSLLVSLLATLLTWLLVNGRARALRLAQQMNRELTTSRERFRALTENMKDVVWVFDMKTQRFHYASPSVERLCGYTPAEVVAAPLEAVMAAESTARFKWLLDLRASTFVAGKERTPTFYTDEIEIPCKNGGMVWVEAITHLRFNEETGHVEAHGVSRDISERRHMEAALKDSEQRYRLLFQESPLPMYTFDEESLRFLMINNQMVEHYGFSREEFGRMTLRDIRPPEDIPLLEQALSKPAKEGLSIEWRHRKKNGEIIYVTGRAMPITYGTHRARLAVIQDVTARKQAEQKLRQAIHYNRSLLEASLDPLVTIGEDGKITDVNYATIKVTGVPRAQLIGSDFPDYFTEPEKAREGYRYVFLKGFVNDYPLSIRHRDGHTTDVLYSASVYRDEAGKVAGVFAAARDITHFKQMAAHVEHMAHFDALTDLPNRTLLNDRLHQALAQARRDRTYCALMFLDLDNFKPVNDTHGHAIGDQLLQEAGRRMRESVRESDTVARIGGDEFVVLLPSVETPEAALVVAEKIRHVLEQPFLISGHTLRVSSSIGIAIHPEHGENAAELANNADIAMYAAKQAGRNNVKLFQAGMG